MPVQNEKKGTLSVLFALLPFILMFAIAYYNSANSVVKPYQVWRGQYRDQIQSAVPPAASLTKVPADRLVLRRDNRMTVDKTGLVYRGRSGGIINMDLYLLELDPDMPYPLRFTKETLKAGVWIDNRQYKLVSAGKTVLVLKILVPE